eukprot:1523529-Prymnesium_polylepis.1
MLLVECAHRKASEVPTIARMQPGRPCRVVHAVSAVPFAVWPLDLTRQPSRPLCSLEFVIDTKFKATLT